MFWNLRALLVLALLAIAGVQPAFAQTDDSVDVPEAPHTNTTTLEDILARQRGEAVERTNRTSDYDASAQAQGILGTLGGTSDSLMWEDMRFNTANITTQANGPATNVLMQDGGMKWLSWRAGPLRTYGGYLLLGTIAVLGLFYLLRGRIRVSGGLSGIRIERFKPVERLAHWVLAGSFILLALTGLISLFGRVAIIPLFGHEVNSILAIGSKWIHNNVSWAFMLALILVFVFWVIHNIPARADVVWLMKGGGLFSKNSHPPAWKFNAGQKLIFWAVIILGVSVSVSGLSLLFPFQMPLFAATFEKINMLGIPGLVGLNPLPTVLEPHVEMQYAQLWHAIVSFLMMAVIIAHIYIGTLGMEGAYDAMGSGNVDLQWAKEHHNLWVEEMEAKGKVPKASVSAAE
ncbi:formate dehydrogenase subunit gamma [Algicella marina]|uniref:Formate dehydrogenase subunit gamma n=1 Tax=Algicella marina TaxID=2683284 RepID=A0A6P1SZU0_9RHOB|nr:formate dehydrogenase subunit gamma [Algicella marina]QHQ35277.1 formate dehydrogenase subunit gamma [Algicella marina]